jgi:hypothetical protein
MQVTMKGLNPVQRDYLILTRVLTQHTFDKTITRLNPVQRDMLTITRVKRQDRRIHFIKSRIVNRQSEIAHPVQRDCLVLTGNPIECRR